MDRLHARYPFLSASRQAVQEAGVDLAALVEREDSPVVERALDRVESAIAGGTVGESHRRARVELLSYPVARVVVSLVGDRDLTRAYARAEARTARERFVDDVEGDHPESVADNRITLDRLLAEFDLSGGVTFRDDAPWIDVGSYLELSGDLEGAEWRLVHRHLTDGAVPVAREELYDLLTEAICDRVHSDLPLSVPDAIRDSLGPEVDRIERALADHAPPRGIDAVVPGLFPPCMRALLDRAREGEDLPPHSAFSLVAFLTGIGMDHEAAGDLCDLDPSAVEYRATRIASDGAVDYPPPSCTTMQAYGDCVNPDDLCDRIDHPTSYYGERLDDAENPTDWRETANLDD